MYIRGSLFQFSKYFMIVCGLWKIPFSSNVLIQRIYLIYSYIFHFIYCTFCLSLLIKGILIVAAIDETENIFNAISIVAIMWDMNLRLMIYLKNGIPQMFGGLLEEEKLIHNSSDREILDLYFSQSSIYLNVLIIQLASAVASTYFYISVNILEFSLSSKNFMYELWIPFPINWKIIAIFKIIICQCGVVINTAVRAALQSLIMFAISHLRILQISVKKLFSTNSNSENVSNVRKQVQKHQFLIQFVENLNNAVSSIILLEFLLDSVNLAAAMLQIITAQYIMEMMFSLVYLILLLTQLFILAWSANEINIQSVNVSNAIYESNWMDQSEPIKKTMLIMLMRAQKPLSLTIGPFRPMNMEAGLITLKGSYTYAGVMRQTYT